MRLRTRITAVAAMTLAAAGCAVAPATVALAAPQKAVAAHTSVAVESSVFTAALKGAGKACWNNVDTGKWRCFSSFAAMKSAMSRSGHTVVAAPQTSARTIERSLVHPLSGGVYLLNTDYADSGYQGTSYTWSTDDSDMCAGIVYSHSSMPSGWNDRVSSFNAYGNCSEKLWQNTGYTGTTYGYSGGTSSLGSFNDQASSERVQ